MIKISSNEFTLLENDIEEQGYAVLGSAEDAREIRVCRSHEVVELVVDRMIGDKDFQAALRKARSEPSPPDGKKVVESLIHEFENEEASD